MKFNAGHQSYMDEGWDWEVYHESGVTVNVDQWGGGFYLSSGTEVDNYAYYRAADGARMEAHGVNGYTGFSFWLMGGILDIAGAVTLDNPNGDAIFANQNDGPAPAGSSVPVLKFSGTDPLLTVTNDAYFQNTLSSDTDAAQIDVSELTLSQSDTWVTVMTAASLTNGDLADFVAGTDGNDWQIQVAGNDLQIKYTGSAAPQMGDINLSGYVDDDDLSLLLANWVTGDVWGKGDLNNSGGVDDDDLSLLLANWNQGVPPGAPAAVPEPATITLVALGGLALIRRRRS